VPHNFRAGRQINPAPRFQRLECLHLELGVFLRVFRAQLFLEPHQESCSRRDRVSLERQPVTLAISLLARWFRHLGACLLCLCWRRLLGGARETRSQNCRQNCAACRHERPRSQSHVVLPANAEQTRSAPRAPVLLLSVGHKRLKANELQSISKSKAITSAHCRRFPPPSWRQIPTHFRR